jgi:hypothetical protein
MKEKKRSSKKKRRDSKKKVILGTYLYIYFLILYIHNNMIDSNVVQNNIFVFFYVRVIRVAYE